MVNRRALIAGGMIAAAIGTLWTADRFHSDLAEARLAARGLADTVAMPFGPMQWAEAGAGPPVLMLHGTGGGFDQGLFFTRRLWADGFRVIAPSRFGYLGTAFPADSSSEAEADAMARLLDHLGIDRCAVAGGSAGCLSALAFAIRHPDRCAALVTIVPATFVPGRPAPQPQGPVARSIIEYGLKSDLLFWLGMTLAEKKMIRTLLATDPARVEAAARDEQERVRAILRGILPVSARASGLLNDGALAGAPKEMDLGRISAPTLALSCEDDLFGTAEAARHIGQSVSRAKTVIYPDGGHVWVGRDADLFRTVAAFLREETRA